MKGREGGKKRRREEEKKGGISVFNNLVGIDGMLNPLFLSWWFLFFICMLCSVADIYEDVVLGTYGRK